MKEQGQNVFGIYGLGTMGRNLLMNMADHGFKVAGFNRHADKVALLIQESKNNNDVQGFTELTDFIDSLQSPKSIMLLITAGKPVDDVIAQILPLLEKGDIIIDGGNSHFSDTARRYKELEKTGIHFIGMGISGGEEGARNGPSMMPGGDKQAYQKVNYIFEAITARVKGQPCVSYIGPEASGHFVKMIHNGIEYGLMQLISEAYHFLKIVCGMNNDELNDIFAKWNKGILQSFLIQITADIFIQKDELTNNYLVDMILDSAHQKGTGAWTSEAAMELQIPIPVIDSAVNMRDLSVFKKERETIQQKLTGPKIKSNGPKNEIVDSLEQALYFSMIVTYAQGLMLLQAASKEYQYGLQLENISKIWRGGCIIRASLLEDIYSAYSQQPDLPNLLLSDLFAEKLIQSQNAIRKIIQAGVKSGIPLPALMESLAYYDGFRSAWLPANLLQAQRDYFGAHTYQRNDRTGTFHSQWNEKKE